MHIRADTLDDALRQIFSKLLKTRSRTRSTKGPAREAVGTLITLRNPRARFSRTENRSTLFSCLGETLWYLSGSNRIDVIEYYIPKYREFIDAPKRARITSGAYGPRIFGGGDKSQMAAVLDLLRRKTGTSDTRQAVIQIFDAADVRTRRADIPCTCTVQFLPRAGKLHVVTTMRSNDAYRGLPHDVFAFTFMQELVARTIGHEIGTYSHFVGSLHLYDENERQARDYLAEGWQERIGMPAMPIGDPWRALQWLLGVEEAIRKLGPGAPLILDGVDAYWADLARLLRMKALLRAKDGRSVVAEQSHLSSSVYAAFVRGKGRHLSHESSGPQPILPGMDEADATAAEVTS